jgi:hypothetical protein
MKIEEFLEKCEAASEVPYVYSEPLARLQMALQAMGDDLDDIEDPLLNELVSAAIEVANGWSFYPPEAYGSNLATIDPQSVIGLNDALAAYRHRLDKADEGDDD